MPLTARWRSRSAVDKREPNARAKAMRAVNPAFIPRNHRVEQALDAAIESRDFSPFADLLTVLSSGLRRICQPASNR
jgi:serine/tyrosine/threonine adenylyltransferase